MFVCWLLIEYFWWWGSMLCPLQLRRSTRFHRDAALTDTVFISACGI